MTTTHNSATPPGDLIAKIEALERRVSALEARTNPIGGRVGLYDSAAHLRKLSQELRDTL
jgi:hypothetical protein